MDIERKQQGNRRTNNQINHVKNYGIFQILHILDKIRALKEFDEVFKPRERIFSVNIIHESKPYRVNVDAYVQNRKMNSGQYRNCQVKNQ